jgi:hypothetical protein
MRKGKILNLGILVFLVIALLSSGCTSMIVKPLLDPLETSLQKQTDLELIKDGAPSLLLLLDGLIADDPDNRNLLMAATKAYGAYATTLYAAGEVERAVTMSQKAKTYGITLLNQLPGLKNFRELTYEECCNAVDKIKKRNVGPLFWGAYGWAAWIRFQEGAPAAMADLPIIEYIMLRVVALDDSYYYGGAHIFLGAYYSSRPEMYGGKPEKSRKHFERALAISNRKFLLAQVAYAETYARMMFDKKLYQSLLNEVLDQPLENNLTASSNKLAQVMAQKLLDATEEYF